MIRDELQNNKLTLSNISLITDAYFGFHLLYIYIYIYMFICQEIKLCIVGDETSDSEIMKYFGVTANKVTCSNY